MIIQRQLSKVNLLLALAALVCSSHIASAQRPININKVILGNEYVNGEAKGGYAGSIFSPTDKVIYCEAGISNPSPDAKYRFVWFAYDPAQRAEKQIFEQELTNQTGKNVVSKLSSPHGLPIGGYRVEVWVNGRRKAQSRFRIMKETN
jgi:hypothetical protein